MAGLCFSILGLLAIGDPGVNGNITEDPVEATSVKSSKSNSSDRSSGGGGSDPQVSAINNSHSNIKNLRTGEGGEAEPDPVEAANLNLSKSNID